MSFTQTANQGIASAIQNLTSQAGLQVTVQNQDYVQCGIGLPGDRKQLVHIMAAGELGDQHVVHIWTPVSQMPTAEMPAEVASGLLLENANLKIGAFAIRQIENAYLLIFFQNVVLESLSPQDLANIIGIVGQTGDQWENKLSSTDQF